MAKLDRFCGTRPGEDPIWHRFVAGGLGEMFAVCFSHPADVLKVRLQLTGEGQVGKRSLTPRDFIDAGRRLVVVDGVRNGLYSGISASWMRQAVFSSTRQGLYGVFERLWRGDSAGVSLGGRLTCAISAGIFGAVLANPTDVVLIRMQADGHWPTEQRRHYKHGFDGLRRILNDEGVPALYRGCGPTVMRAGLVTSSQIVTYEETKAAVLRAGYKDNLSTQMFCSIMSATVAVVVIAPVDCIKTRIMNMQSEHGISYKGPLDCVQQLLRTEGPRAFYKGFSALCLRQWPHTVLLWFGNERVKSLLRSLESQ